MTAPTPLPDASAPTPAPSRPHALELAQARLVGVLETLRLEGRLDAYHLSEPREAPSLPTVAARALKVGASLEEEVALYTLVSQAMREGEFFADLELETEAEFYAHSS